jgi:hypothetical protein
LELGVTLKSEGRSPSKASRPFLFPQQEQLIMATEKQIAANRRNAQKSTGPKSEEGKTKAKFNALKHGMTADTAVLPYEDPNSYEQLREALIDQYRPANAGEQMLVELVVVNYWRLLRARRVETASFRLHIEAIKRHNGKGAAPTLDEDADIATAFADPHYPFRNIERYQSAIERSYFRAVETLRRIQNDRLREERRNAPAPQRNGSVPKARAASATSAVPVGDVSAAQPRPQLLTATDPENLLTHYCFRTNYLV